MKAGTDGRADSCDAYAILGVDPDGDDATIAAAYRALARRYHPDVAGEAATERMIRRQRGVRPGPRPERGASTTTSSRRSTRRAAERERARAAASTGHRPPQPRSPSTIAPRRRTTSSTTRPAATAPAPPAGRRPAVGIVLAFGRHLGWSIGEIARIDPGYLVWLEERREGRPYLDEIDRDRCGASGSATGAARTAADR